MHHQPPQQRRGPVARGASRTRYGSPLLVHARHNDADATRSPSLRCPQLLVQPTEAALFGVMRSHASRRAIGGFWRSLQQQLGEAFGGVGELEALARSLVELVGDGVEL